MTVRTVDAFCGAGGITTGLSLALEEIGVEDVDHLAVNHWDTAIQTHRENHPWARHLNKDIEHVKPRDAVPSGHLDLLAAAPECTFHSNARGGRPTKDQKRMQPWFILPWLQELYIENVLIENVPEFRSWGPLDEDGNRIEDAKGDTFDAFIGAIRSLGYAVDWRVLNAADYGDPTTRKRLFIVARRNARPVFPTPTHSDEDDELPDWRSAAEIIDWSDPGQSLWTRGVQGNGKRPLVQNTMRRIAEGIRRYAHPVLEPFADAVASIGKPDMTQMQENAVDLRDLDHELAVEKGEPFLVKFYGTSTAKPTDEPLDTVTGGGQKFALATPYLLGQHGGSVARSIEDPVMTVATDGAIQLLQPDAFILPRNGRQGGLFSNPPYAPREDPLHVVTASNHDGHLVRPYLVPFYGERAGQDPRTHDLDDPLPTVPASKSPAGISTPFLVQYNGNSDSTGVDDPLPTQPATDRFALCLPELYPWGLDIRFRMLQPRELARAMGFPDSYAFHGTKTDTVRQIGNAVAVNTAKQLCLKLLTDESRPVVPPERAPEADEMEFPPETVVADA